MYCTSLSIIHIIPPLENDQGGVNENDNRNAEERTEQSRRTGRDEWV